MSDQLTDQELPDQPADVEDVPKHLQQQALGEWARENLFPDLKNSLSTVVFGAILVIAALAALRFAFISGRWDVIFTNTTNILVGTVFPREEVRLAWVALFIVGPGLGLMVGSSHQLVTQSDEDEGVLAASMGRQLLNSAQRFAPLIVLVALFVTMARGQRPLSAALVLGLGVLIWGMRTAGLKLPRERATLGVLAGIGLVIGGIVFLAANVGWDDWGGLLLTMFVASASIVLCFPFGVLVALGRRSELPAMRWFSVAYIELIRGVPLITLLFMGQFADARLVPPARTAALARDPRDHHDHAVLRRLRRRDRPRRAAGGAQGADRGRHRPWGCRRSRMTRLIVLPAGAAQRRSRRWSGSSSRCSRTPRCWSSSACSSCSASRRC